MKKIISVLLFVLALPIMARSQASRVDDIIISNFGGTLHAAGGLTITVCQSSATGLPCSPKATIYTDSTAATSSANPFTADANGNYGFWVTPGVYVVTVTGTIPAGYTKTYVVPVGFNLSDSSVTAFSVYSCKLVQPLYPLGNDCDIFAYSGADIHLAVRELQATSGTSCTANVQCTVTISSPTIAGQAVAGLPTALFSTSQNVLVEPGSAANQEFIALTSKSDPTLTFTPTKNHTQPFFVREQGTLFLDTNNLRIGADATGQLPQYCFGDAAGNCAFWMNKNPAATFPLSSPQFDAVWTGRNGVNKDILFQQNNAASHFQLLNHLNTSVLFSLDDSGQVTSNATGTDSFVAQTFRIASGAATLDFQINAGIGAGQIASLDLQDNGTTKWQVQKSSGNNFVIVEAGVQNRLTLVPGGLATYVGTFALGGTSLVQLGSTTVSALPSAASNAGAMIQVSDSTTVAAEGQTCVGSSTNKALAFSNGTAWKCF
jgi:hypothetical protein